MTFPKEYNPQTNYIGAQEWQMNITQYIYRLVSGYNYSAYWHDFIYEKILFREHGFINMFALKFLMDTLFLIQGFFRCLRKFQLLAIVIGPLLYLALVFSSPWVITNIIKRRQPL